MPEKINPSILEAHTLVIYQILGYDAVVSRSCEGAQLELNIWTPIIAHDLIDGVKLMTASTRMLREQAIRGITADAKRAKTMVESSPCIATALNPYIGYERAASIIHEARHTGRSAREVLLRRGWFTTTELNRILAPESMTAPRRTDLTIQKTVQRRLRIRSPRS